MSKTAQKNNEVETKSQPSEEKEEVKSEPVAEQLVEETSIEEVKPAEIDQKTGQLILTPKHIDLIKTQIAKNATKQEFELFLMMAYRTRLDPLMKQLYFIKYGDKVSYVTSIDGYRIIAHRTNEFAGTDEPIYSYDKNGKLTHCTVTVFKMVLGEKCGFTAKVKFDEYSTGQNLWKKMPETMIAKVAEAHALRKAFPQDLSGIYTTDEMDQAGNDSRKSKDVPMVNKPQVLKIKEIMNKKEITVERLKSFVKKAFKTDSVANLTQAQANTLIKKMSEMPDPEPVEVEEDDYSFEEFVEGELQNDSEHDSDSIADDVFEALG